MSKLLSLSMAFFLASCAAWRANETIPEKDFQKNFQDRKESVSASFEIKRASYFVNDEADPSKADIKKLESLFLKTYKESGQFDFNGKLEKDLKIESEIIVDVKDNMLFKFISGFTLFLSPSRKTQKITIKTTFIKNGEEVAMIEKSETVKVYRQLFLLFIMPFKPPFNIFERTVDDLNCSIIIDAINEGILG